ncbi:OmpA family protein [Oceanibaculum nanhaiense]|uniref:OmpA family protein n=1 Tax=Oceanibaculum nanhaiense TaxID=1909734 RepID=UPI00396D2240
MKIGLAATAGLLLLAGCSSVPDAVNPVEWYKGATSLFEDDEAPATERPTAGRPAAERSGESQAYPNLGSVPARPADISSPSERRATQQGLVADRDQARYTDQQPANAIDTGSSSGASRTAPAAAPTPPPAVAPTAPAPIAPASVAPTETPPRAAAPTTAETAPSAPPAARIASRAEPTETQSVGAAMLERRRQEVLAERAAAAEAADDSKPPMAPATAPQPSAPQSTAPQSSVPQSSAPAAMTEPAKTASRTEPKARTATEIYQEQFARSASPVATRSAEPTRTGAQTGTQAATAQDTAAPTASDRTGISYLAATILFGHGSTALDPSERETLRKIAAEYRKTGGTLRIVGHASSRTTDMRPLQHQLANFQVSVSRAETVAQELARLGVPARVMQVAGVGDSQPVYYEVMPAGETGNRRVEIFVDY